MQNTSAMSIELLILLCLVTGMAMTVIGVWVGSYIMHRGFKIGTGSPEGFFGTVPKGEVFNISEPEEAAGSAPDEEINHLLNNTDKFLQSIKGLDK